MSVTFDRLEKVEDNHLERSVICSFETRSHGYLQVRRNNVKAKSLKNEPSLYNFTDEEREYISTISLIVNRLVFDGIPPEEYR